MTSIKHALVYLGESGVRQFVSLVATSQLSADKPYELIRTSITRARLCELLADCSDRNYDSSEMFLMGLFSLLGAMLDMPMAEIMERLPLPVDIKKALVDQSGPFYPYLATIVAYENGDWQSCQNLLETISVSPKEMLQAYMDSLTWTDTLTNEKTA